MATAMASSDVQSSKDRNFVRYALTKIFLDATDRAQKATGNLQHSLLGALTLLPLATAQDNSADDDSGAAGYPLLNSSTPSYDNFTAGPVDPTTTDGQKVLADVHNFVSNGIDWGSFQQRASQIRGIHRKNTPAECVGNLSVALAGVGNAYQAGASGATTLLTLLPTAGALIGTPVTELWVLYKLMPAAGIVSMLLSLGGNIVPTDVNDYEKMAADFTYSGMIGVNPDKQMMFEKSRAIADEDEEEEPRTPATPGDSVAAQAQEFARQIAARARDTRGSRKNGKMAFGIATQVVLLGFIMIACWFMQSGSIVVWWCTFWPWMYFWYCFVAISSLLENLAGVPFTKQWTIRVSRAPKVEISDDAPWVIPPPPSAARRSRFPSGMTMMTQPLEPLEPLEPVSNGKGPSTFADEIAYQGHQLLPSDQSASGSDIGGGFQRNNYSAVPEPWLGREILHRLKKGYNTHGRIILDHTRGWSAGNNAFYVIISVRGVTNGHAFLRIVSKILSIGVYTVGTALFASSTLTTIMVAVVVASLVIIAGVFGRVTAMWMVSELMKDKPILHKVAKNEAEADQYMEAMLRKPDMVFEVLGHVITGGRCIKRYRKPFRWSKILGVLADPYDITKLAMPAFSRDSRV